MAPLSDAGVPRVADKVVMEGLIGVGKSTVMAHLSKRGYQTEVEPVHKWKLMLPHLYKDPKQFEPTFEKLVRRTQQERNSHALEKRKSRPDFQSKPLIVERDIPSAATFLNIHHRDGNLGDGDFHKLIPHADMVGESEWLLYLKCTPEVAHTRIRSRARNGEAGVAVEFLRSWQEEFERSVLPLFGSRVIEVESTNLTLEQTVERVNGILDTFKACEVPTLPAPLRGVLFETFDEAHLLQVVNYVRSTGSYVYTVAELSHNPSAIKQKLLTGCVVVMTTNAPLTLADLPETKVIVAGRHPSEPMENIMKEVEASLFESGALLLDPNFTDGVACSQIRRPRDVLQIMEKTTDTVRALFRERAINDQAHNMMHILAVTEHVRKALKQEEKLREDQELVLLLAAVLHEVDDTKLFATDNYANARRILVDSLSNAGNEAMVDEVVEIIDLVSARKNKHGSVSADNTWKLIVRDADRIEAMGEVGIARCYAYNRKVGSPMFVEKTPRPETEEDLWKYATEERFLAYSTSISMVDHYYDKLLHLGKCSSGNSYLEGQMKGRLQVMIDFCLEFGRSGTLDLASLEALREQYCSEAPRQSLKRKASEPAPEPTPEKLSTKTRSSHKENAPSRANMKATSPLAVSPV